MHRGVRSQGSATSGACGQCTTGAVYHRSTVVTGARWAAPRFAVTAPIVIARLGNQIVINATPVGDECGQCDSRRISFAPLLALPTIRLRRLRRSTVTPSSSGSRNQLVTFNALVEPLMKAYSCLTTARSSGTLAVDEHRGDG